MSAETLAVKDLRYLVDLIAVCPDGLTRARYGRILADRAGYEPAVIAREVEAARRKKRSPRAPEAEPPRQAADLEHELYRGNSLLRAVIETLLVERPCFPQHDRRAGGPTPREILQGWDGGTAWKVFVEVGWPVLLGAIAEARGAAREWEALAEIKEKAGLWRPEADLDAWVEVVGPTFCIGPEMYRLRYGMLPAEILEEEIAMEERQERAEALASYVGSLQRGQDPEDGGFLYWFLEEAREEELRTLLEAEKKVQRGLWPEWEDEENLQQWIGHLEEDWQAEYALVEANGGSELECAQAVADMMSRVRSRSILNAAARLGYDTIKKDYGTSGKLVQEETR